MVVLMRLQEAKQMERLTERYDITPDGESDVWVKQHDYISTVRKLCDYEDLEEQGLLVRLPCKVGDIVYVDSTTLPIENMECYEDICNKIPSYFQGRVVSFRFAQRNWVKIAVKVKRLYEYMTGRKDIYAVHIHGLPDSTWRQNSKVGKKFTKLIRP